MTFAEFLLTCKGYETRHFLDYSKHRLTAYMVYCSIPEKTPKKTLRKWMPLPIDEDVDLGVSLDDMRKTWKSLEV